MILVGFYLNSFLTKFVKVRHIFIPASIFQGASLAILFLFKTLNLWSIFFSWFNSGFIMWFLLG